MSDGTVIVPLVSTGVAIDNETIGAVQRQRVRLGGAALDELAVVIDAAPAADAMGLVVRPVGALAVTGGLTDGELRAAPVAVDDSLGAGSYQAATLTSGTLALVGRLVSLRVFAVDEAGSFTIDGGAAITVRAGSGFDWAPRVLFDSPTIAWVSGTLDVFAELV